MSVLSLHFVANSHTPSFAGTVERALHMQWLVGEIPSLLTFKKEVSSAVQKGWCYWFVLYWKLVLTSSCVSKKRSCDHIENFCLKKQLDLQVNISKFQVWYYSKRNETTGKTRKREEKTKKRRKRIKTRTVIRRGKNAMGIKRKRTKRTRYGLDWPLCARRFVNNHSWSVACVSRSESV